MAKAADIAVLVSAGAAVSSSIGAIVWSSRPTRATTSLTRKCPFAFNRAVPRQRPNDRGRELRPLLACLAWSPAGPPRGCRGRPAQRGDCAAGDEPAHILVSTAAHAPTAAPQTAGYASDRPIDRQQATRLALLTHCRTAVRSRWTGRSSRPKSARSSTPSSPARCFTSLQPQRILESPYHGIPVS